MMDVIEYRCGLIEARERQFARALAGRIIPPPELSVWMVLIPLLLVYYFYHRERCRSGAEQFGSNYLVSCRLALEAAGRAAAGEDFDPGRSTEAAKVPASAREAYTVFIQVLADHYQVLLEAEGDTYEELARAAYGGKSNYLLFCHELGQAEKDLNAALQPQLADAAAGCDEMAARMEKAAEELRRQEAERIFAAVGDAGMGAWRS